MAAIVRKGRGFMMDVAKLADGLLMKGCYIQMRSKERRDEDGRKKRKFYVMVALPSGAYDVAVPVDEFDRLSELLDAGKLKRGDDVLVSVEAFAFRDKVYFRAEDDVRLLSNAGEVAEMDAAPSGRVSSGSGADAVSKMEAAISARVKA